MSNTPNIFLECTCEQPPISKPQPHSFVSYKLCTGSYPLGPYSIIMRMRFRCCRCGQEQSFDAVLPENARRANIKPTGCIRDVPE